MISSEALQKKIIVKGKPYQINALLGQGSHAIVHKAQTLYYPHEEITIKIARESQGIPKERVENEIWLLKELSHENIPPLLDSGNIDGHLWLAMPVYQKLAISIASKGTIENFYPDEIDSKGYPSKATLIPYKIREKITIAVLNDIVHAIDYIAGTGIVHADISPGNIMETKGSLLHKKYVLTDWGASALIHRYPSKTFGSLHFTAPERLLGEVGIKSDIFSLGVVCFYLLTGTVPYSGETAELYYLSVLERDGISPSAIEKNISSVLDKTLRDMIRHKASDRIETKEVIRRIQKL